jgi:hypothetical protein
LYYPIQIIKNIIIPKTQDAVAFGLQELRAFLIVGFLVEMLRPQGVPSSSMISFWRAAQKSTT